MPAILDSLFHKVVNTTSSFIGVEGGGWWGAMKDICLSYLDELVVVISVSILLYIMDTLLLEYCSFAYQ